MNKKSNRKPSRRRLQRFQKPSARADAAQDARAKNTFPLEFATPLLRIYAYVTDITVLYFVIVITKQIFGGNIWTPEAGWLDISILLGYFVVPTMLWGRTIGKAIVGLVVVDDEGYPCGLRGLPREIAWRFVAIAALGVGVLWLLFDAKKQGWHDKLAGTYVVYNPNSGIASWFRKKRRD